MARGRSAPVTSRDRGRPFCLLVQHKAPHANWEVGPGEAAIFEGETIPEPESLHEDLAGRSEAVRSHRLFVGRPQWELHFEKRFGPIPADVPEEKVRGWVYQRYIKDYLRCAASVDTGVGRVLDLLDGEGLAGNTVVVYSSDQGFFLGEHGLYDKRLMYEESIRMPLIVRWPGVVAAGARIGAMALNVDFAPTLIEVAGVLAPADLHGRSLVPLFRGERPRDWRTSFYYRYYEVGYGLGPIEGVRTMEHKLTRYGFADGGTELYDLEEDPSEMRNIVAEPTARAVAGSLANELARLREELGAPGL
jgi:arylsulfatase A-like enzyme